MGLVSAETNLAIISNPAFGKLGDISRHCYVDCKFDSKGLAKTFNIEALEKPMLKIRNISNALRDNEAEKEIYFESAKQALCFAHLICNFNYEILILLNKSLSAPDISDAISTFACTPRIYECFRHAEEELVSHILDARYEHAKLAVLTTLQLYLSGAVLSLATCRLDYVLGCALAAVETYDLQELQSLNTLVKQGHGAFAIPRR